MLMSCFYRGVIVEKIPSDFVMIHRFIYFCIKNKIILDNESY